MDKFWTNTSKKGSQSAVNLPGYYKKGASSSVGRNIDQLAEQFNKYAKEEHKSDPQLGATGAKTEFKGRYNIAIFSLILSFFNAIFKIPSRLFASRRIGQKLGDVIN